MVLLFLPFFLILTFTLIAIRYLFICLDYRLVVNLARWALTKL